MFGNGELLSSKYVEFRFNGWLVPDAFVFYIPTKQPLRYGSLKHTLWTQTKMCTLPYCDRVEYSCITQVRSSAHPHAQVQTKPRMVQYDNLADYWACTENSRLWPWTSLEDKSALKNHDIISVPECGLRSRHKMGTDHRSKLRTQQKRSRDAFQTSPPLLLDCRLLDCSHDVGHFGRRYVRLLLSDHKLLGCRLKDAQTGSSCTQIGDRLQNWFMKTKVIFSREVWFILLVFPAFGIALITNTFSFMVITK